VRTLVATLTALAVAGAALAAPTASRTFAEKGFEITFKYPDSFHLAKSVTLDKKAGASAVARRAVALDRDNALIVSRFALRIAITRANIDRVRQEVDRVFGKLAGRRLHGKRVTFGGLPGYEYRIALTKPAHAASRLDVMFLRKSEYLLNCQWTARHRADVARACSLMLSTLHAKR
jgi:hypothetical protein